MELKSLRGVEDILPPESEKYTLVIETFRETVERAGFKEVILPVIEDATLFSRSVGETTDIVQKEMYTFKDKGGRLVALRPEGTAGAVRAYIEHAVYTREPYTKWFYTGAMFRFERPQKGRRRQFLQAGCEVFGLSSPGADAELIKLGAQVLERLNVPCHLQVNSIGCERCRSVYRNSLLSYLKGKSEGLCPDCKSRMERNPLRVLDCKLQMCREVLRNAPSVIEHLCPECRAHFDSVLEYLKLLKVEFEVNPFLVRGLDYYTKTVFEFVSNQLGAQGTLLAGGRYDRLISQLGGPETPALGFALGVDRTALLAEEAPAKREGVFVATAGDDAYREGLALVDTLRSKGFKAEMDHRRGSFKSQIKNADRAKARFAVIIGEDELKGGYYSVKDLETGKQEKVKGLDALLARL